MDEDFFLNDFSLQDIDFDFNIFEENIISPHEANMDSQRAQHSSNFEHQMSLDFIKEKPKAEMMKIKNKPNLISFEFSSNYSSSQELGTKRSSVVAKEHVLAERKRREKLSAKFIALSALLPGLKKADKLTVLDYAILHMKKLQEQIIKLKEEKEATREIESMIVVKKYKICFNDESYLTSSLSDHEKFDQELPEIEAKVSQNEVLIRIHCEKSKGCMINILNTIENLQLQVENSVILPFGDSILDITILAQMEKDFQTNMIKDLVRKLRLAMV